MTLIRHVLAGAMLAALLAALLAATPQARAHELPADRLTIVQRDARHVSLQLFVDLPALLHRCVSPQTRPAEFILALSAQPPAEIEAAMRKLKGRIEPGVRLTQTGAALKITQWRWPSTSQVQSLLQQRAMQLVVGQGEHTHDEPLEITADAVATQDLTGVNVELPAELRPLMLVSYRPRQRWVDKVGGPLSVEF